ncbi:uncharacterized protein PHALS_07064 [Plasmopara halstedii]|uniref:Uncharacterized protein n=1 Tax=Plasmopara halstedii TaxID=4781 RepID=A0A0P1B3F7_PLAHL|nr:uncharacterized protein PHALS_07064 [Plasmopara halstedii]CEG49293.1 hypothetical protein PHALS_07064 [Plasmopara halstedii]|eukprot:XP_024585662.1 hypothetical protein PHALS_07064 [Plasmopara halstedii]
MERLAINEASSEQVAPSVATVGTSRFITSSFEVLHHKRHETRKYPNTWLESFQQLLSESRAPPSFQLNLLDLTC